MMDLFLIILNMSITASYVTLAVIMARFLLRCAPKIFSYILWSAVLIRLVIPVSFTTNFSLLRFVQPHVQAGTGLMEFVPRDIGMLKYPIVDAGVSKISHLINSSLPGATTIASVNPMQIILWLGSIIWITGVAILLLYSIISYLKILTKVRTATLVKDHVYETDQISTPFVCGFLKPKIYIPTGISEHELSYILLHEQTHILRRDYLIKPFAFMIVILHWFNPMMWLSYSLMSKDMEMSCDERVVNKMGDQIKGSYSTTLLSLSVSRSGLRSGSPLAFGESHVKERIKNILSYRQPSSWMVASSMLVIAALIVGCTSNPTPLQPSLQQPSQSTYSGYNIDKLMKNKTLYVGNHVKVGGLFSGMAIPVGLEANGLALQTNAIPYGATINYIMTDSTDVSKEGAISGESFYRNSILLLSLIDNVDSITYSIADNTGQYDGATYSFTFTREQVYKLLGEDVRHYATDATSLRKLIDRLDSLTFNETSNTTSYTNLSEIHPLNG
ncbi:M56 family metallopeptidase [Paenibacillus macquariensis]|nr:M56 family metallopeptidase [Paenibacillus macquariensis]MEC0091969.1 M56 family metallopeptidase [Paenibacillus macquariensis]OAB37457.1 peptidase M56 BlaR1 [Paenibacillus macquariensis subsp. macquariensis]